MRDGIIVGFASLVWIATALSVAFPAHVFDWDVTEISKKFISVGHFVSFAFLIIVDLLVSIFLLSDEQVRRKLGSKKGLLTFLSVVFVLVIIIAATAFKAPFINGKEIYVTFGILFVYWLFRCNCYIREVRGADAAATATSVGN